MMELDQNTSQSAQQYISPSKAAYNPDQSTKQHYVTVALKVFSGIHLTWAVVYIVLGMVDAEDCYLGSVAGPLFLVIGSFSIAAALMKHKKLIFTMMIFSIICSMVCGVMFIVASIVLHDSIGSYNYRNRAPVKLVVILIGTLIEGGISAASAVICFKVTGCRRPTASSYTAMPQPELMTSTDVTGMEGGVGFNQVWCSPPDNNKPAVSTLTEAGVEPPAYDAPPETEQMKN